MDSSRISSVRSRKLGLWELRLRELRLREIRLRELRSRELRLGELGFTIIHPEQSYTQLYLLTLLYLLK